MYIVSKFYLHLADETEIVYFPNAAGAGTSKRARWSHQMKLFLITLLKEHDVPGLRTQNAWSKEAWTNIVSRLNTKFGASFSMNQVKQKEQDLKKDYRSVKELLAESGFGWDKERMMVDAPASVWASFVARKNSKDALHWQDRSFPYFDALAPLYDGELYTLFIIAVFCNSVTHISYTSLCRSSC
jgi:hypothetical protein